MKILLIFLLISATFFAGAQTTNFSSGSFIVDMGLSPQTISNGLKPYGMVYDLIRNYDVPVYWIINPNKLKDGIDFVYNGTSFKGGPFIIAAENRTATVDSRIAYWISEGIAGQYSTSAFSAPVSQKLTSVPRWTLDLKSGQVAQNYITNAGIPIENTNWVEPYALDNCNDIFVMPHADPKWDSHNFLINWNNTSKGSIWASCHAVSVLENMFKPTDPTQQANFLALNSAGPGSNALVKFGSHKDGSLPYNNNSFPADPVMQFMGSIDAATDNGSESIYLPASGGGWRPTTKIGVYDPTHINVPSISPGKAAVIAYGRAYGNAGRGLVMYEAGHNHDKGGVESVAAQRAFLNFSFMATLEKTMDLTVTGIQNVMISNQAYSLSAAVSQSIPTGPYTVHWSSTCGGTFSSASSLNTNFTPPMVGSPQNCVISVKVTDACGRSRFYTQNILITSGPRPPIAKADSLTINPDCININPVITINALANDSEPDGQPMTISSLSGSNGTWSVNPDQTVKFIPATGFYGTTTANYTVCDNSTPTALCASSTIKISIGSSSQAPTAIDDNYLIYEDSIQVFDVLANDLPGSGSLNLVGIPISPKNGKVSINVNNTITYLPNADYYGTDSFYYKISSSGGYLSTGKVIISIKHDCCAPGNYKRILGPVITTTQNLVATADSYIKLKATSTNYGTDPTIILDRETTDKHVGVLNFDLSGLICYATLVRSASLKLQKVSGNDQVVSVYRLLNPWAESQVTWNSRLTSTPWATPGGEYNPAQLLAATGTPVSNIFTWNMDAIMQNMVCNSTSYPNYGFIIRVDETGGNRLTVFASRENTTAGILKPTMQITFDSAAFICSPIPVRPPLAMPDTASTNSNNSILINAIANDQLPSGHAGTLSIVSGSVTSGTATIASNKINFQPNLTFQGLTSFQYVVTDNITGLKDTAKTFVYVSYPAPVANNDTLALQSGDTGTKNIITNDIDAVGLGINYTILTEPIHGNYTKSGNTITYTAPFNFYGIDTISYRLTNVTPGICNETTAADTAFLIINVSNRPPVTLGETRATNPCQPITIDVLQNDSDPENGVITVSSISAIAPAGAGTASTDGAYIYFVPNPAFTGSSATFTYTIADDASPVATSNASTVTVNIGNISNLSPVAVNDTINGLSNEVSYINVLLNDHDPDEDDIAVSLPGVLLQPSHGTIALEGNGLIKYTPHPGYSGGDVFEYRLQDSHFGISGGVCTSVSLAATARVYVSVTDNFIVLKNELIEFTGSKKKPV